MKRKFFIGGCYTLLFFLIFLSYQESFPQVVIKEKIEIMPENSLMEGSINNDPRNPVYLQYGGDVVLRSVHRTNTSFELWEEELGQIAQGSSIYLGVFPQWNKFIFYLLDPSTGNKYYTDLTTEIVDEYGSSIDFYPSHIPGEPYPYNPEDWWAIDLYSDYSLAAMPPPEILNYLLNPFIPSEPLEIPSDGSLYAIIYSYTDANDELWMDLPNTQMVQNDLKNHDGEEIELGEMTAGDSIRFFLISSNTIVGGKNLYAWIEPVESPAPNGDVLLWRLYFEDWTDLYFDDIEVDIYLRPHVEHFEDIAATVEPEELTPGDTAKITFKKKHLDGTLEDFPEWQTFEVGIDDGCVLGNLLVDGETGPYFLNVSQPVYFIADSSADSGTVNLKVGLVETIAGKIVPIDTSMRNTNSEANNKYDRAKLRIKEKQQKSKLNKSKKENIQKINNNNISLSSCFIQDFRASDISHFSIHIKTEEFSILLGETKYYQAKYNAQEEKLMIEEIKPGANRIPHQKTGTEDGWEWITGEGDWEGVDVWGDNSVSIIEGGDKLGVYWEKRKPIWGTSKLLEPGLIRLVGRYWEENQTYKVKLSTIDNINANPVIPASIEIEVKKPRIIGTINNESSDINSNSFNIDEKIIYWAGIEGVPPQIIKSQIRHESSFNPGYRYEPVLDARYQKSHKWKNILKNNAYWIKGIGDIGEPTVPSNVSNLRDGAGNLVQYPGYSGTIWNYFDSHRNLYNGQMKKIFNNTWNTFFIDELKSNVENIARQNADERLWNYLRYKYNGGFDNLICQTRIMASYGLLQLIYFHGITESSRGYPNDLQSMSVEERLNPPERLNSPDQYYFYFSIRHLKSKFNNPNIGQNFLQSNWVRGYNETWHLALNAYNGNRSGLGQGRCPLNINEEIDYGSQVMCWSYNDYTPLP